MTRFYHKSSTDFQRIFSHEAMAQSPTWADVLDSLDVSEAFRRNRRHPCVKAAIRSCRAIETLETSLGLQQVTVTEQVVPYSGDQPSLPPFHLSALYLGIGTVIVLQLIIVWSAIRPRKRHQGVSKNSNTD